MIASTAVGLLLSLACARPHSLAAEGPGGLSPAQAIHRNARLALREGRASDVVRLWLLRNAVAAKDGRVSAEDEDQRALTWVALSELGLCPDGLRRDPSGIWTLALHNQLLRELSPGRPAGRPNTFAAFELGRQQRAVGLRDVLDATELSTLSFRAGSCGALVPWRLQGGGALWKRPTRSQAVRMLLALLDRAERELDEARVRGRAVITARRFDLLLVLAGEAEQEARARALALGRTAARRGLGSVEQEELAAGAPPTTLGEEEPARRILEEAAGWSAEEWLSLEPKRALFLFDRVRGVHPEPLDGAVLAIIDGLLDRGETAAIPAWIGRLQRAGDPPWAEVWGGERGRRLLALPPAEGRSERAVLALHRGVHELAQGRTLDALRLFAFARAHAAESAEAETVAPLSQRWLHHVAGRHALDRGLLEAVRPLLSRTDFQVLLEEMCWRAALVGDAEGLQLGLEAAPPRSAMERRARWLLPLARGETEAFLRATRERGRESAGETLRFLDGLVQRLEAEERAVRQRNRPTLLGILDLARAGARTGGSEERRWAALRERAEALERGLVERAELDVGAGEQFAGSVRLAPTDALPWPFPAVPVSAPSVFVPLRPRPVEWQAEGAWVFGWRIEG